MKKLVLFVAILGSYISKAQTHIGIGTTTPSEPLEVNGNALISDTLKLPKGAITGYVLTSDSLGKATWQPAACGISGLKNKAFLFGRADGTIGQDTTIAYDSIYRTLRGGTIVSEAGFAGKTITFMGNSITYGTGTSSDYKRYTSVATRQLYGLVENNLGQVSTVVHDGLSIIPHHTSSTQFLSVAYGINEVRAAYTHSHFVTDYKEFLDTAIARGWQGKDILICSISGFNIGFEGGTVSQRDFNAVMDSLHRVYGTMWAECYESVLIPEYNYCLRDLHPDDNGSEVMGYIVAGAIRGNFKMTDQKLAVNGTTQLSDLYYKNQSWVPKGHILGMDSTGHVGAIHVLADMTTSTKLTLGGALVQRGAVLPDNYDSLHDIVLNNAAKFEQGISPTNKGEFVLFSAGGNTTISNKFSGGTIWITASGGVTGGSVTALTINPTGNVKLPLGLEINYPNSVFTSGGAGSGYFIPLAATGFNTEVTNRVSNGNFRVNMGNGVTNGSTSIMFNINNAGRTIFSLGGSFTDIPSARVAINSTTEGFLLPRMTTPQKNAISSPATGLFVYDTDLKRKCWYDGVAWQNEPRTETGTSEPSSTPTAVGDRYIDTSAKKIYFATGTSSSADWTNVN